MTEIAIREEGRQMAVLTNEQLQYIASTEFVPPGLRGNLPAILACVATGRALGIADMSALRSIHIIDGKATFSAELMVQLVRRDGHSITGEVTDGSATVTGKRADTGDVMTSTWTLAMAERAGLVNKQNWKKYPEAMLWARAVSQLCRMLFADCFSGNTYTPEELEGVDDGHAPGSSQQKTELPGETFEEIFEPIVDAKPVSASTQQKKKLDVLVGQLRDKDHVHTEHLYQAIARMRDTDYATWVAGAKELAEDGELHWGPLRDSLSKEEASHLIDRLSRFEADLA